MPGRHNLNQPPRLRRVLVAHRQGNPDAALFRYTDALASAHDADRVIAAVDDEGGGLSAIAPQMRALLGARHPLTLDLPLHTDSLAKLACEHMADVILLRPGGRLSPWSHGARRLAFTADRPVWFLPRHAEPRFRRVLVHVDLSPGTVDRVAYTLALTEPLGLQEIVVAHVFAQPALDHGEEARERAREEQLARLEILLSRVNFGETLCTPITQDSLCMSGCMVRIAREHRCDLVVDSLVWPWLPGVWSWREARRYLQLMDRPILTMPAERRPPILQSAAARIFSESEPMFS